MISGKTKLIPLFGYPPTSVKAPFIYNPWFDKHEIDAMVVPMGIKPEDYPVSMKAIFNLSNVHGALVTMPHKITTMGLVDECSTTARIAGAANAILKRPDGSLLGDMFDGTGFQCEGARGLVIGAGGVGSAIAASLAAGGMASIALFDVHAESAQGLAARLKTHYPGLEVRLTTTDPVGYDLIVNCTPLGMKPDDPLPFEVSRIAPTTFVGEVVMKHEITPMLKAAQARGCRFQVGADMLFEMIPPYLEFFGFGDSTPEELRSVAQIQY